MNLREAAQQALEALEVWEDCLKDKSSIPWFRFSMVCSESIKSLRYALAEQTNQESRQVDPVAYVTGYFDGKCVINPIESVVLPAGMALYRSPPKRKPLTNESILLEYQTRWPFHPHEEKRLSADIVRFARAIERAHGIGDEE